MNIYVRKNNNDLFKFLTQKEIESLPCHNETYEYSPQEFVNIKSGIVNVVKRGIVNVISQKTGKVVMSLSEGEIFGEEKLFQKDWSLIYQCETQTVINQHSVDLENTSVSNNLRAKIHAALNDSLSEKLIRLSHNQ